MNNFLIKKINTFIKVHEKLDNKDLEPQKAKVEEISLDPKGPYSTPSQIIEDYKRARSFGQHLFPIRKK